MGARPTVPARRVDARSPPRSSRSAVGDGLRDAPARPRGAAGGGGRAVDEPVDRADPRSGRRVPRRRRDRAAEQQEHRAGGASRCPTSPTCRSRWCPPPRWSRRWARSSPTTPTRRSTPTRRRWPRPPARVRAGEVTQAVRDSVAECGPIADRRLDRHHARRHPGGGEVGDRRRGRAGRRADRRRRRAGHDHRGRRGRRRRHRARSASTSPTRTRTSRSRCTTATSRSTRTSSASSSPTVGASSSRPASRCASSRRTASPS